MPYISIDELPPAVRHNLPRHALEIYLAAYNNAWEEYSDPARTRGGASQEEVARRVAWAAVKKEFIRNPVTRRWEPVANAHAGRGER